VAAGGKRRREGFAEKRERLGAIDDPAIVLEAALRFLEPRQRSIGEVRRRLTRVGYGVELVEGAIERLVELGMLDDAAFATAWVESRDRARPRGERALRQELRLKGVEPAAVDAAMDERRSVPDGEGDPDVVAAEALLARHAAALARVADPRRRRQRAYALLVRSGFDPSTAGDVVRTWAANDVAVDPGDD
jgi:regulatory protein